MQSKIPSEIHQSFLQVLQKCAAANNVEATRTTGCQLHLIPRHSMSVIYAYIDPSNHPNVDKYTMHGVFGIGW